MQLKTKDRGYAVMNAALTSISLDGYSIENLKPYCKKGDVIVERVPKVIGFSISICWHKFYKRIYLKYSYKNILWLHWSVDKEYRHKTGKIVHLGC